MVTTPTPSVASQPYSQGHSTSQTLPVQDARRRLDVRHLSVKCNVWTWASGYSPLLTGVVLGSCAQDDGLSAACESSTRKRPGRKDCQLQEVSSHSTCRQVTPVSKALLYPLLHSDMVSIHDVGPKQVMVPVSFGGSKSLRLPSLATGTQTSELCFQFMCLSTVILALKPVVGHHCPQKHRQLLLRSIHQAAKRLLTCTAKVMKDTYCLTC